MRKRSTGFKAVFGLLLLSAGPPLAAVLIQRYLSSPDAFRTLGMRGSLTIKRAADVQAEAWSKVSAMAATSYQKARL